MRSKPRPTASLVNQSTTRSSRDDQALALEFLDLTNLEFELHLLGFGADELAKAAGPGVERVSRPRCNPGPASDRVDAGIA